MLELRLQKYMADQGICSRRKAEVLIAENKVKVNGKIVNEMGIKINPEEDEVEVEGKKIKKQIKTNIYIVLNKPVDYITSVSDEQGKSVMELLTPENNWGKERPEIISRVYPVGRLDKDSEGLVLLTNDGELANQLMHPKYEHEKEYEVLIDKMLSKEAKKVLEGGMSIGDEMVRGIKIKKEIKVGRHMVVTIILGEGKNRQIRKMFGTLGYHVISLRRTRIVNLKLGTLPIGRWVLVAKSKIV